MLFFSLLIPHKWGNDVRASCCFQVCVAQFGFHTNIIVPVKNEIFDWRKYLTLNNDFQLKNSDNRYLGFGWGERNWYMNPPTELPLMLRKGFRALFFPNPSVLRVQKHDNFPQNYDIECIKVKQTDYLELMEFINNSFQLSQGGEKIRLINNPYTNISFYEAKGTYSILRNSNNWTAEGLKIANINTPLWAGLSGAIMHHLRYDYLNLGLTHGNEKSRVWARGIGV
ncbi:DUF2459 domain-containing protein [Scytonema tolypothrichoides VB-61278]|nr:DUF2459 domain-containing protein [Scytonema tolypothrichoides VB-61278]